MKKQYGTGGNGLPGNDDYGTMSAWYIFSALGFYPQPATENYILGSSLVSHARIYRKLNDGIIKPFNIRTQHGKKKNTYKVESINLDGQKLNNFITHSQMSAHNSMLTFVMD